MEELSKAEYSRLNAADREAYLTNLLGKYENDSNPPSDSEDEDWIPYDELPEAGNASDGNESTDESNEDVLESDDDDSENGDSETNDQMGETPTAYIANDKTEWQKTPVVKNEATSSNDERQQSGPHESTDTLSIQDTFKKFMTLDMVSLIVDCTNKKAESAYEAYNAAHPDKKRTWRPISTHEMYCFMGLLIHAGANNCNTDALTEMWKLTSYPIHRATMKYFRFQNILHFIRFGDAKKRQQRLKVDRAAPIRELWTMLNRNLSEMYKPTQDLMIDEQLYPFRGRTKLSQYDPSKLAKIGIKVCWLCDAKNGYPLQGAICTGNVRDKNQDEKVMKELVTAYQGNDRTICMDDHFATLPLAKQLLSINLKMVGTLKKNEDYIPRAMIANKSRENFSSIFGFHDGVTLCSYVPKKNKSIVMISTAHSNATVNDDAKKKPEMIVYYNKNKSSIESLDQRIKNYTTARRTLRWPLAMFFNILDISCLAAYIIYYENNDMIRKKPNERRLFMRQLSLELAVAGIDDRANNLQKRDYYTKTAIESVMGWIINPSKDDPIPEVFRSQSSRKNGLGFCYVCNQKPIRRKRKTPKFCSECDRAVCAEHAKNYCKCMDCDK